MQIAATLVKGKARIKFEAPKVEALISPGTSLTYSDCYSMLFQGTYSLARAQQSFKSLVHIHEKNGDYHPTKIARELTI